jgi:hypothetical protein
LTHITDFKVILDQYRNHSFNFPFLPSRL